MKSITLNLFLLSSIHAGLTCPTSAPSETTCQFVEGSTAPSTIEKVYDKSLVAGDTQYHSFAAQGLNALIQSDLRMPIVFKVLGPASFTCNAGSFAYYGCLPISDNKYEKATVPSAVAYPCLPVGWDPTSLFMTDPYFGYYKECFCEDSVLSGCAIGYTTSDDATGEVTLDNGGDENTAGLMIHTDVSFRHTMNI